MLFPLPWLTGMFWREGEEAVHRDTQTKAPKENEGRSVLETLWPRYLHWNPAPLTNLVHKGPEEPGCLISTVLQ